MAFLPYPNQLDSGRNLAYSPSKVSFSLDSPNLEEELAAVSENTFVDAGQNAKGKSQDEINKTEASEDHPCFRHRAEDYLNNWTKGLQALAALPCTQANKSDILSHAATLCLWMRKHVIPHVRGLQTYSEMLEEGYDNSERDNDKLGFQIGMLRHEYEEMYEAYARGYAASLEKTEHLGEVLARAEAILKRMGAYVDDSTDESEEMAGGSEK